MANERARDLRKRLTPQEVKLWVKLRDLKQLGHRVRRQVPIDRYIVDFAILSSRLVIEVDGGQHGHTHGLAADKERDRFLVSQGFKVLRYWNSDIDRNLDEVVEDILRALDPHPARFASDPPHKGEG